MSTTRKLKKYSKMSDEALKKRMSKKSNFPRDPRDYPQGSSPKPIAKKKQTPPKKKQTPPKKKPVKKSKGNCKGIFKKGIKVGVFLAKSGKLDKKKSPKKKSPKKIKIPQPPANTPTNKKWTREDLQKLPPQGRKGNANLSSVAKTYGVRVTKTEKNSKGTYTRKRKTTLIEEILRAQK